MIPILILILIAAGCSYVIATLASQAARWRDSDEGRAWVAARRSRRRRVAPTQHRPSRIDSLESRLNARIDAVSRRVDQHVDRHAG
jgi:hypothetical protein